MEKGDIEKGATYALRSLAPAMCWWCCEAIVRCKVFARQQAFDSHSSRAEAGRPVALLAVDWSVTGGLSIDLIIQ